MMDIAINGGRDHNNAGSSLVGLKVLGEVKTVGHGSGSTDENKTCETIACADLKRAALLLSGTELITATADIVVATKVDEVCEVFASHLSVVISDEAINTIDKADKLDVAALGLVSEKTINNIVTARGLTAHVDESDLLSFGLINSKHALVECVQLRVV